eukprot:7502067-Pyramimonas_sp.AAC.1
MAFFQRLYHLLRAFRGIFPLYIHVLGTALLAPTVQYSDVGYLRRRYTLYNTTALVATALDFRVLNRATNDTLRTHRPESLDGQPRPGP